jgi:hypothetical protein
LEFAKQTGEKSTLLVDFSLRSFAAGKTSAKACLKGASMRLLSLGDFSAKNLHLKLLFTPPSMAAKALSRMFRAGFGGCGACCIV